MATGFPRILILLPSSGLSNTDSSLIHGWPGIIQQDRLDHALKIVLLHLPPPFGAGCYYSWARWAVTQSDGTHGNMVLSDCPLSLAVSRADSSQVMPPTWVTKHGLHGYLDAALGTNISRTVLWTQAGSNRR
ncbi:hypothetical protein P152DRAFT_175978 [Eremomyces bilateralis CBS 781.70]|uniref:Uncharacterized protein n=1 Tax=Eremomyces bilateralis CBS 781.70 TaxID=1392243 RepID=A0A6G1FSZ1_9PEZI|nr:uncharacterized protein P152DRAFT_175978 [Eremomyces bilateralis CBS 781.70]KAF1808907.1 hypothetical protein P152DRAFT_175978 [Eremomyces bilateralis CBS 781.70]